MTASARFAGRVYQDQRRNAVFPHYDLEGMCGCEIRIRTKNLERIVELSKAFPSLAEQGSVKNWDAMALDEWAASGIPCHGEKLVAQFLLRVWNQYEEWECGKFDPIEAQGVWDDEHWQGFQKWTANPFTL